MTKTSLFFIFLAIAVVMAVAFFYRQNPIPTQTPISNSISSDQKQEQVFEVVVSNLQVPWAIAFLPDKSILVTERAGRVRLIKNGRLEENPVATINVKQTGESGLHGIAIHPKFPEQPFVYLYYTYSAKNNNSLNEQVLLSGTQNRVSKFNFKENSLTDEKVIVDNIPGAIFHDGGRIKFGPDGNLYITTGDAQNPSLSQDKNSFAGKILRVTMEGKVEVYSYGHRNPQGITWDDQGRLWEVEHGQSATDEINLIEGGKNYGWPDIRGDQTKTGMEKPILHSRSDTWAPAGAAFYKDSIFFAGLRGATLYQYIIDKKELKMHFRGEFGRIRDVVLGPDKMLYITTSNRDGRGNPDVNDDKIIRINPEKL